MITITSGTQLLITCTFKKNGIPDDLSTWDIKCAIRETPTSTYAVSDCVVTKSNTVGVYTVLVDSVGVPANKYFLSTRFAQVSGPRTTVNEHLTIQPDENWA